MAEVRAFVGNGIWKLVERAVPAGTSEAQMDAVYEAFNPYYAKHCADLTVPYDGILPLLQKLQAQGVVCALVSTPRPAPGPPKPRRDSLRSNSGASSPSSISWEQRARAAHRRLRESHRGDRAEPRRCPASRSLGLPDRDVLEQAGAACICDTVDALYQAI